MVQTYYLARANVRKANALVIYPDAAKLVGD